MKYLLISIITLAIALSLVTGKADVNYDCYLTEQWCHTEPAGTPNPKCITQSLPNGATYCGGTSVTGTLNYVSSYCGKMSDASGNLTNTGCGSMVGKNNGGGGNKPCPIQGGGGGGGGG